MGVFITEKETEEWLESETRKMLMPDGTREAVTNFNLNWDNLDFILDMSDFTEEEITELALQQAVESGKPFKESYFHLLDYIYEKLRTAYGISPS